jgi:hypothetical protein
LHLLIIEQVACLLRYWHHHEKSSQRLIQFDDEGASFWLKMHRDGMGRHSTLATRKAGETVLQVVAAEVPYHTSD